MKHLIAYLALTTSFLHAIPQEENLVALWSFEGSLDNTVTTNSSGGIPPLPDGTFLGDTNPSYSSFSPIDGSYLQFDGEDDYVAIGDGDFFDQLDSDWSASVWFRPERAPDGGERFFIFETTPSFPISLGLREGSDPSNTQLQIFTDTAGSDTNFSFQVPDTEITNWNHILITYADSGNDDGTGTLTAYLNGTTNRFETTDSPLTTASGFRIGTFRSANNRFFLGDIDEVALWDTALTEADAEDLNFTFVTTSTDEDDGNLSGDTISLREAINHSTGLQIRFDPSLDGQTIFLSELGELNINRDLTIDASSLPNGITIDGNGDGDFVQEGNETRCFYISDNNTNNLLNVTLKNLTIRDGSHNGSDAGANIHNRENLVLENCQILNGRAFGLNLGAVGGGIFHTQGNLNLFGCTVSGNQTQDASGGGISSIGSNLTLTSCTISDNQAQGANANGGGIFSSLSNLTLTSCTVSGNRADGQNSSGGGIWTSFPSSLLNCTIVENSANRSGGGIFRSSGTCNIIHCTIVGNTSAMNEGAGIAGASVGSQRINISNSIVSGNETGTDIAVSVVAPSNPFIFDGENLIGTIGPNIDNVTPNPADIMLAPLGNFGGETQTMPPLPGSPAIDAAIGSTSNVDQRGFGRVAIPDIGAVETDFLTTDENPSVPNFVVTTRSDELDFTNAERSLREAIALVSIYSSFSDSAVITFDESVFSNTDRIIYLTLGEELALTESMTIDASGIIGGVIIDGNGNGDFTLDDNETRCFLINDDSSNQLSVTLKSLTIQNGAYNGVDAGANIHNSEELTLENCQILNGRAFTGKGGGIYNVFGSLTMNSCTVSGNGSQGEGGGVWGRDNNLTMKNCIVSGNQTLGDFSEGGGIFSFRGTVTLTSCTVSDNQTLGEDADGGGVCNLRGELTMNDCTISDNQTLGENARGGGIWVSSNVSDDTSSLVNCTITGNSTLHSGGGGVFSGGGLCEIEHCTIVGNTSPPNEGAGVGSTLTRTLSATTRISHSIISGNEGGYDIALSDETTETFEFEGVNLIGTAGPDITVTLNPADIVLEPLGDYGGPTQTMRPLAGSPAIDAAIGSTRMVDQRGFVRVGIRDIGAVELQTSLNPFPFEIADFGGDEDLDGLPNGLEFIFGTDHETADLNNPRHPDLSFGNNGERELLFGKAADLPPGLTLRIMRSPTLEFGSFVEVANYNSTSNTTSNDAFEILIEGGSEEFSFTDTADLSEAFYRLEAEYAP